MTITYFPELALFLQSIHISEDDEPSTETFTVTYNPPEQEEKTSLEIPLAPDITDRKVVDISLHQSPTKAYDMGESYNAWFSSCLSCKVMLVYLGPHLRPVLGNLSPNAPTKESATSKSWLSGIIAGVSSLAASKAKDDEGITFADVAPYLVVTEESLNDVSSRLPEGMSMDVTKFRPNIVLSGSTAAYDEDFWAGLNITSKGVDMQEEPVGIDLTLTANCARCQSINIDYSTGKRGLDESGNVLKKLMKDRRVDQGTKYSPIFGRYGFLKMEHPLAKDISIGDTVTVSRRNDERTKFGKFSRECSGNNLMVIQIGQS